MTTFKEQADIFIQESRMRGRKPVRESTIKTYQALLNSTILPLIGDTPLAAIDNGILRSLVAQMRTSKRTAATINLVVSLVKSVIKSAVDPRTGERLYPREWNNDFIDLPDVDPRVQNAPVACRKALQAAIRQAIPRNKALYALLAGAGLRIAEAQSLLVGSDDGQSNYWVPSESVIKIRQAKTDAGIREIDLSPELNQFMIYNNRMAHYGRVFPDSYSTIRRKLKDAGVLDGCHSFRRFRVTHLEKMNVPPGLIRFWTGHASPDITGRYVKIGRDIEARKEWAAKAGLGFELEAK
jgi:integrase